MLVTAAAAPPPQFFDVASVKPYIDGPRNSPSYGPQGIDFRGVSLAFAIAEAYRFPPGRIVGPESLTPQPLWGALSTGYDIVAKADQPASREHLRSMLQALLIDRFHLQVHRETRTGPVYLLTGGKNGPKLEESDGGMLSIETTSEGALFHNAELERLCSYLSSRVDRIVVDGTHLPGLYNFILQKAPGEPEGPKSEGISVESKSPAVFAEGLKRLGLQLSATRAPVEYLVVDRVEHPTGN